MYTNQISKVHLDLMLRGTTEALCITSFFHIIMRNYVINRFSDKQHIYDDGLINWCLDGHTPSVKALVLIIFQIVRNRVV